MSEIVIHRQDAGNLPGGDAAQPNSTRHTLLRTIAASPPLRLPPVSQLEVETALEGIATGEPRAAIAADLGATLIGRAVISGFAARHPEISCCIFVTSRRREEARHPLATYGELKRVSVLIGHSDKDDLPADHPMVRNALRAIPGAAKAPMQKQTRPLRFGGPLNDDVGNTITALLDACGARPAKS